MSVIKTGRNHVYAYEPLPEDSFVLTYLRGPTERHLLSTRGIDAYQAAVDWAVGIADQMAHPIVLVPITFAEYAAANSERMESWLAQLDDQQRGKLRREAVAAMLEVMRDCPDPEVRADAMNVLKTMKVI